MCKTQFHHNDHHQRTGKSSTKEASLEFILYKGTLASEIESRLELLTDLYNRLRSDLDQGAHNDQKVKVRLRVCTPK